nr:S24/S26 family peptidase [Ornithinimicrobium sediminis]
MAVVRGRSMEPTLRTGDRLLVRLVDPAQRRPTDAAGGRARPRAGDLVVVRLPDGPQGPRPWAVKRLRRVEPSGALWVESDAPGVGVDSWTVGALPSDRLLGRVILRLPGRPRSLRPMPPGR